MKFINVSLYFRNPLTRQLVFFKHVMLKEGTPVWREIHREPLSALGFGDSDIPPVPVTNEITFRRIDDDVYIADF